MNDKQKILAIIGVLAFIFWIFVRANYWSLIGGGPYGRDFVDVMFKYWYQGLSFAISIACLLGVILFKDK